MKKIRFVLAIALIVVGLVPVMRLALGGDVVAPASVTVTNFREEAESYISGVYYYEGTTLRFTNCVIYSGTDTNSSVQGLDDVSVIVDVGTTTTNIAYTGTVQVATNGTWWADVSVPSNLSLTYVQTKISDTNGNTYIYPWKMMRTKESL